MMLTWDEIQTNAAAFAKRWQDGGKEKQEAQSFVRAFLDVFGVEASVIDGGFESPVKIGGKGHDKYIDFLWAGQIAVEMKSKGESLTAAFNQLQNYMNHLPDQNDVPDLWLVCDFVNMRLNRRSTSEIWSFKTKDLRKHIKKFANIAGYATERVRDGQVEVNVKAAEKMAQLHDALKEHGYEGHDLEVYLVRLLFCLFADDTGIFPQDSLYKYFEDSKPDGSDLSERIGKLFEILNLPPEARAKRTLLSDELKRFRYINGGLFAATLPTAEFNAKMRQILLDCSNFDWNKISPAIFGAMFQGVMDKTQRRELGAHYTSEENILKLINPLFMDELWREFDRVKTDPTALDHFHGKIARLKFLDPACGCGNFLIVTYRELRTLELEVLKMKVGTNQLVIDISPMLKVSVEQFYGIEYEDFPCQIAQVGMWLIDHQMNLRVSDEFGVYYARLPLTQSAEIVNGNALRLDWEGIVAKRELSYILGNPPFSGRRYRTAEQIEDVTQYFAYKDVDYVACWHKKAAAFIQYTQIQCAFVSTNSICQGEQVAAIWETLFNEYGINIKFAYRTFKWANEAKGKAAVHCIIVGFCNSAVKERLLVNEDGSRIAAKNINPYLLDAPAVFLRGRSTPLCDVPAMKNGNVPLDGDALKIEAEDFEKFKDCKYVKRLLGGNELINNESRYVLWLVGANPAELNRMPHVKERIEMCRKARLAMKDKGTQKLAEMPMLFRDTNNPESFIALPMVSSERRKYIPMGYFDKNTIPTNQVQTIPGATLYHFGILTSNVHMAWTRAVCGRLEMRYRYSKDIVYNNFPWPVVTDEQKEKVEQLAQEILDVRAKFEGASLADLYDPLTMPPELLKAHQILDRAVMKLYGFSKTSEAECVAALMERYQTLAGNTGEAALDGKILKIDNRRIMK